MKFEFEILDKDLEDRAIIIEMRAAIEERIQKLSEFSKNNLVNELNALREESEWLENRWVMWQRDRVVNKLSEVLNADREMYGDSAWHDD